MFETLSLVDFVVWKNPMAANNGVGRAKEKTVQDETLVKESYKAKLMGVSLKLDVNVSMEEDFVLKAEDVATEMKMISILSNSKISMIFDKVLLGVAWVVFGRYLSVRNWLVDFLTTNREVDSQLVWICLPGFSKSYYSDYWKNYWTYDSIDAHTDTAVRERFSRLDVSVDLKKPLI
ncbi:hypothetical protein Goklo_012716 [Gossypium klotzschianum]|uniref:DUF4283 domain-containing protein n=1 Tax=Gossypium klotzschianum TaxID=34286 RepID=A0A7J8VD60_9ROSI|nr:hypothetical protein [Gossypium klotzschianum]